jgi:hypothetical protein
VTTTVADRDDTLAEHLPQLLRLAAALTGSAAEAERLAGQALARVRPADLGSGYPLLPLRQAIVQRFQQRSFRYVPVGELGRLPRFDLVVLALTHVDRLTPAELATTVERPATQVQGVLAAAEATGADADRDLAAELHARAELEVDPGAVHQEAARARGRLRRSRSRAAILTLVAVAVVAMAIVAPGAVRARWPVDPRPVDRWAEFVELDRSADGWTIAERVVAARQESVAFARRSGQQSCTLTIIAGDTLAAVGADEEGVHVNGHQGVLRGGAEAPSLRWAYADGGVADLSCTGVGQTAAALVDQDALLGLASAVRFRSSPLLLPFRLANPSDFSPAWVTVDPGPPTTVALTYSAGDPRWSYVTVRITMDHQTSRVLGPTGDTRLDRGSEQTTINGRTAFVYQDRDSTGLPEICLTDRTGRVCLSAYWTSGDQTTRFQMTSDIGALLQQTADQVQLADNLYDESTWFDARSVLG